MLGNYHESLNDAKAAVELQPHSIKAIARGKAYWHTICSLYFYIQSKKNIETGDLNNGLQKQLTFAYYSDFETIFARTFLYTRVYKVKMDSGLPWGKN